MGMANKNELAVPTFLKQWRTFRGLTQEVLAERAGVTPPSISQLENGKQGFTDDSLARLARVLKCTPAELLAFDPTKPYGFLPLFQAAERLQGPARKQLHDVVKTLLPNPEESE